MKIYESYSEKDTLLLSKQLGANAKPGDIYCLIGDLGVGKTLFSKGFSEGMRINEPITSPTFTIVHEYEADIPLYHFDVYRLSGPDEMEEIGYEEYFYGDGVCLVEWANIVEDIIPKEAVYIYIEKDLEKGLNYRKITVQEGGSK